MMTPLACRRLRRQRLLRLAPHIPLRGMLVAVFSVPQKHSTKPYVVPRFAESGKKFQVRYVAIASFPYWTICPFIASIRVFLSEPGGMSRRKS